MNPSIRRLFIALIAFCAFTSLTFAADPDLQPLAAQAIRLADAMEHFGAPLHDAERQALEQAGKSEPAAGIAKIQSVLDPYCLGTIQINPESRVKVARGVAPARLVEQGWRTFLVTDAADDGYGYNLDISNTNVPYTGAATAANLETFTINVTPEPASLGLFGIAGLGLLAQSSTLNLVRWSSADRVSTI